VLPRYSIPNETVNEYTRIVRGHTAAETPGTGHVMEADGGTVHLVLNEDKASTKTEDKPDESES
jgi:hypothetical protein